MKAKVLTRVVYTEAEFCKIVKIGLRTARRLRKAGELTHGRTGRKVWYTEAHVERYFTDHTINAQVAA